MNRLLRFFATGEDQPIDRAPAEINRLFKRYRASIMAAITVGYGFSYTCRLALSVVKKPLIDTGMFTASDLGVIGSAFFYTYAFGRLTNGFLADHANIRRFFPFGLLISALINVVMGSTVHLWVWAVLWGLNGWFQGFGSPASVVAMAHWFSNRERGSYYGFWSTAHALGEGLTFVGTAAFVNWLGWRAGFTVPGVACIAIAVGLYLTLRDRPRTLGLPTVADWKDDHGVSAQGRDDSPLSTAQAQWMVVKMPQLWVLGLACATMSATRYAINSWGILYLQEARGYSLVQAGGVLGVNTAAGIVGCIAYGLVSDRFFNARRPPVTFAYGVVEVLSLLMIFWGPTSNPAVMTAAFVMYGFSMSGILAALGGLFAIDIASKRAAGAAMGFIGVFSYLGAAIQERISGILIHQGTTLVNGVRHYDFARPTLFWIGTSILSLVLASTLWRVKAAD